MTTRTSDMTLREDGVLLLRFQVLADDDFDRAADGLFDLLRRAQKQHPGAPRELVVRIEGHSGERAGYDENFFEFQQEFLLGALGPFFTSIDTPLTGVLHNPEPQNDTVPDALQVDDPN